MGRTPLHYAALAGQLDEAQRLLAAGADPNARDDNGWSPLHFAAQSWQTAVASLLVDSGAEVDAQTAERQLHLPIVLPHEEMLRGCLKEIAPHLRALGIDTFRAGTHAPTSRRPIDDGEAIEINVASMTDWPMEGVVATLSDPSVPAKVVRAGEDCDLKYDRQAPLPSVTWRQACVHEPVAGKLASMTREEALQYRNGTVSWESPKAPHNCDVARVAATLACDVRTIEQKENDADPTLRHFFLCLATKASSIQCGCHYDATCDSRLPGSK